MVSLAYEVAPNKHGVPSGSSQHLYCHNAPTTSSSTAADPSGQDSFFSGVSLHGEYGYVTTGPESKDAGLSSSSTGILKTVHMYQAEHSTKHSALTSSQSSTPMPEEGIPGARLYSLAGTGAASGVSTVCRSRAPSGSGIPLPELATASVSYAQRGPQLRQAVTSSSLTAAPALGTGNTASHKEQYVASRSYYGLPSSETSPPILSQGVLMFQSGSHTSVHGTNSEATPQASTKDRTSSSKESLPDDVCDGQAVRQVIPDCASPHQHLFHTKKEKAEDVAGPSRLASTTATPAVVGGPLTGPQPVRADSMRASHGPWQASLSAQRLPVDQDKAYGAADGGAPVGHTYTYTSGETEEPRAVFAGDTTKISSVNGSSQEPSYGYYSVTSPQTPHMQAVQHLPGYFGPGIDYPSTVYAPGPVPGTYVSYDGGVAYLQHSPMLGESFPSAAYATSYGAEPYYAPPRFSGTYFMDAGGNTHWSAAAPVCSAQMCMQVPESVDNSADALSEVRASHAAAPSVGRGGDQRRASTAMPKGYAASPVGYPVRAEQGSPQPQQCSVQQLVPSVASFYYAGETVPTPLSGDESRGNGTTTHEGRMQGDGGSARTGRRRTRTNWCCDAF
ncbi:Proteophosphoglycan 5, related [Neospora caninum Liverpool]|uniref:Proteophosphoglycan 5, related n=1 Tax=Neospora caninum (strain Liverpool) TaxID=572307 RepID=F0VFN4_NEOCL|nr:Proteophosphoglycan 5, related [Neospora caninum Liverpool]CBZ52528.1 Proteophosphoglycan 5, related [Neospora caninum Liverpool]CEL66505.1 TPA: Proteophosphoglycan 5, related [Neospora caninum Liverpool]|eukprot:XP_003882560.1 Proteophosphoglycan 5, related [Neospora caninum Liverpool]